MDPSLADTSPDALLDLVVRVTNQERHAATMVAIWHNEPCRCIGQFETGDCVTLYGVQYKGLLGGVHQLQILTGTQVIPKCSPTEHSFGFIKEACAGLGGISLGCQAMGGTCLAVSDVNALACAALRQHFETVVEGDIQHRHTRLQLHLVQPQQCCILGASLPRLCSSFASSGSRFGGSGVQVLQSVLQLAWHSHACAVILESSSDITLHLGALQAVGSFAAKAGLEWQQIKLDLASQWASSRPRWWTVISPAPLLELQLSSWPEVRQAWQVQHVIPAWPVWPQETEIALQLDADEIAAFEDSSLGSTDRMLLVTAQAPQALHSWGNVLRKCPCGCREQPPSIAHFKHCGMKGICVISQVTKERRHPHPLEVGLLNAMPPKHPLPADPRAALCLMGRVSSPLQAIWILAHLRAWEAKQHARAEICPGQEISRYQARLLQQRQDGWVTPHMLQGGRFSLSGPEGPCTVTMSSPLTVGELIEVERALLGPGYRIQILDNDRVLSASAWLHPQPAGPTYQLVISAKRARLQTLSSPDGTKGRPSRDDPQPCNATPRGGPSASVAPPDPALTLPEDIRCHFPLAPVQSGPEICTDTALWCCLLQATRETAARNISVIPPSVASVLLSSIGADRTGPHPSLAATLPEGWRVLVPFVVSEHWTLLALRIEANLVHATVFDGIPGHSTTEARWLATILATLGGHAVGTFQELTKWSQTRPGSCGTIAIAHALTLISDAPDSTLLRWAEALLAALPPLPHSLVGQGGLSTEQIAELKGILVSKGVPGDVVDSRLQAATVKLGAGPIAQALARKNIWQALKALGSKPGSLFKWVQPTELQAHIEQRAQTRYGTEIPRPKAKKQKAARTNHPAPLHVDPTTLQLVPGSFLTKAGSPLGQLSFAEVQAGATGICFCSSAQAAPFLAQPRNLSVDALALVTTATLPADAQELTRVTSLRFPAVFSPTHEAILVTGSMIQLGDEEAEIACASTVDVDNLPTLVVRLSLYRDECKIPWDKLVEAPIRVLLQNIPEFQICRQRACDRSCTGFHAAVDEEVEHLFLDVWARQWCRITGGKVKADAAELFQVFIRVPASALPHMFCTSQPGLYVEPRASDGSGPHGSWAVVWLPGATAAQAQHALKTTEKAISLARLGSKYGLRTKEADEQFVFEALRPQHQFLKVRVTAHYRLHPLPHGFQRHALVQQLKHWNWNGKPLQPDKGDAQGGAWLIGASGEPPLQALPLGQGFVLATKV